jgi:hypothetical protein
MFIKATMPPDKRNQNSELFFRQTQEVFESRGEARSHLIYPSDKHAVSVPMEIFLKDQLSDQPAFPSF